MFGLNKFIQSISNTLHRAADAITPKIETNIQYLPSDPVGEIRERKVSGVPTYFWHFQKDGKSNRKYLSRDKDKAEQRREELSGWLFDEGQK